jgi:hypothetical protein
MPLKSSKAAAVVSNVRGANKEAQARYLADVAQRQRAATILNPTEVAGEYDAGRMLVTTLGGAPRLITQEDIRTFRQNVKTAGKKFKGGITAKSVIDMSTTDDRERANRQIRTAVPVQSLAGRMHFITNAGPDSEVTRHHVHIELLNYSAAVSSPAKVSEMAKFLATGPLKFDCDCGRHRYWFRYIATIGQFNSGRDETGYPKIRNPKLIGVGCKHVLRVMQQLGQPMARLRLERMIQAGRDNVAHKVIKTSAADVRAAAERQAKEQNWKRHTVESAAERAQRLALSRSTKKDSEREKAKAAKMTPAKTASAKKAVELSIRKLAAMGLLSAKQLASMLSKIK